MAAPKTKTTSKAKATKKVVRSTESQGKLKKTAAKKASAPVRRQAPSVLLHPYITEKTANMTEKGRYAFVIDARTNKSQVKKEVEQTYGVKVQKVTCVRVKPQKTIFRRRYVGTKAGMKKAYVILKKGEKIDLYTQNKKSK